MMVRQPEPPNNPFGKLLDMGFAQAATPASPPAKKKTVSETPQGSGKAKPGPKGKSAIKKKTKKAQKASAPQSFRTSLPNARNLTAAGTKKAPPYREEKRKNAKPNKSSDAKRPVKPEPPRLVIRVDPLIEALPQRTMQQLQGQWLNCLRLLEDPSDGKRQAARKFRDAILAEWERRCKLALSNPDYFDWPSTQVGPADRSQRFETWNQEGVLKYMGYEVGKTKGLADHSRREILDAVFGAVLPPVNGPDYIKKWGLPVTASRLERLANELARFARNGKRNRTADYSAAVADWEADLRYLHRKYYLGKFQFGWPSLS
jgi:hypothetical protein